MKNPDASRALPEATGQRADESKADAGALARRIREAAEFLEELAADRSLLAQGAEADQRRLIHAAGEVWIPDPAQRRALTQARARRRAQESRQERGGEAEPARDPNAPARAHLHHAEHLPAGGARSPSPGAEGAGGRRRPRHRAGR